MSFFMRITNLKKFFENLKKKVPHQRDFLTPLAPNFDFFSLWCHTLTKNFPFNTLEGMSSQLHTLKKKFVEFDQRGQEL